MKKVVLGIFIFFAFAGVLFALGLSYSGCAAVKAVDLPVDVTPDFAEKVACEVLFQNQCFGDVLNAAGIRHETCNQDIDAIVSGKVTVDIPKASDLPKVCKDQIEKIQKYAEGILSASKDAK